MSNEIPQRVFSGVQPTGNLTLGNYLGAIRKFVTLQDSHNCIYCVVDLHAITIAQDPVELMNATRSVAAAYIASGIDVSKHIVFNQSRVHQHAELAWIFNCIARMGWLNRMTQFKEKAGKDRENASVGLFSYPTLMASDILVYRATHVPVGDDQKQHLELTRDIAMRLSHVYGEGTLVVPEALISDAPLVPGTDGEKMSKSKGNGIPLFESPKKLRKVIMGIKTTSESLEDPKTAEGSTAYELYSLVAPDRAPEMKHKLAAGGYGWGHAKEDLFQAIEAEIGPKREKYLSIRADEEQLDAILHSGADKARQIAHATIQRVRGAVGID